MVKSIMKRSMHKSTTPRKRIPNGKNWYFKFWNDNNSHIQSTQHNVSWKFKVVDSQMSRPFLSKYNTWSYTKLWTRDFVSLAAWRWIIHASHLLLANQRTLWVIFHPMDILLLFTWVPLTSHFSLVVFWWRICWTLVHRLRRIVTEALPVIKIHFNLLVW